MEYLYNDNGINGTDNLFGINNLKQLFSQY